MKVLNIVVHLGGGIGTTLKNFFESDKENEHVVACLNPYDERSEKVSNEIYYNLKDDYDKLNKLIEDSYVVILHWYNNPLYYDMLINNTLSPCRLIIWALANNLHAPYSMPEKLVDMSDRFIVSSPVSYESDEYKNLTDEQKDKFNFIWCSANMNKFQQAIREKHDTFNIGYAGTIDFNSKLHPDFVDTCSKIAQTVPNVKFIMCSSGPDLDKVKEQVKRYQIEDKFEFTGRVEDLSTQLSRMDIFLYMLYEKHYGTSEQVLGEAMSCGAVPVVLDNLPEYFIVEDNKSGIITVKENVHIEIKKLYDNRDVLNTLSINAKKRAFELYDTKVMINKWKEEFDKIVFTPKRQHRWKFTGYDIFMESLGETRKVFDRDNKEELKELFNSNRQWHSISKGSVIQYSHCYPEDERLKKLKELV